MISYDKTIPGSPPIECNLAQLNEEINSNGNISPKCMGITHRNDDTFVTFDFSSNLSGSEETELENVFASHTVKSNIEVQQIISFEKNKVSTPSFTRVASYSYTYASSLPKNPLKIEVLGYVTTGSTGTIRLYDKTNHNVICEVIMANTTEENIEIPLSGSPLLWPTGSVIIEVQAKSEAGKGNLYLNSMTISY
jgi:hypothetical protein